VIFASTVNLLPGTLSAELNDNVVTIHALNASSAVDRQLQELERRVARLFHLEHLEHPETSEAQP
jgi:multicomponent Na+:H+ antiporter subunit E